MDPETKLYYCQSRYYDPQIRRFINADNLVSTDTGFNGFNMFAYCNNNPVNNYDPTGHWIIKNAIKWVKNKIVKPSVKWVAKKVIKPIVKATKKVLSKVNATYSSGTAISGSPGIFSFGVQGGVSIDTEGNVAVQATVSAGFTTGSPSFAVSSYQTVTNAPTVNNLTNIGYQIGGSASIPIATGVVATGGGDINVIPDDEKNKEYFGLTQVMGAGFGTPGGEFHVGLSDTYTIPYTEFNIFDVPENVYRSIMEW